MDPSPHQAPGPREASSGDFVGRHDRRPLRLELDPKCPRGGGSLTESVPIPEPLLDLVGDHRRSGRRVLANDATVPADVRDDLANTEYDGDAEERKHEAGRLTATGRSLSSPEEGSSSPSWARCRGRLDDLRRRMRELAEEG